MSPEEKNVLFPLTRQATVAFGFVTLREDGTRELIASHALLPFEELRHDVNPADDIGIVIPPDALPVAVDLDFEHAPYEGDRVFACTDVSP